MKLVGFISSLLVAGCVTEPDITPLAVETCSRRMAQEAAVFNPRGLQSALVESAEKLEDGTYSVMLRVTIEYQNEVKSAQVNCVVSETGTRVVRLGEPI